MGQPATRTSSPSLTSSTAAADSARRSRAGRTNSKVAPGIDAHDPVLPSHLLVIGEVGQGRDPALGGSGKGPRRSRSSTMIFILNRHRDASFVITSNRAVEEWLSIFHDPILGNSALDRLANASYQIVIEGPSYRERQSPHRALVGAGLEGGE